MSSLWGSASIGRPDARRQRRAQRLVERFHAGLIDGAAYLRGLQALFAEEFSEELVGGAETALPVDPDELDRIRQMFPTREDAPGLWLVLGNDRCHFCGRQIPVLALKSSGDDPGSWVHICLDDLELIRSQAEEAL